jgi:hypothetical protein
MQRFIRVVFLFELTRCSLLLSAYGAIFIHLVSSSHVRSEYDLQRIEAFFGECFIRTLLQPHLLWQILADRIVSCSSWLAVVMTARLRATSDYLFLEFSCSPWQLPDHIILFGKTLPRF